MDKVVDKIVALGVPGLVLLVAMTASGWAGGAAIVSALATLGGPFGMLGGIGVLIVLALISRGLATYGFESLFKATVKKLINQGTSKTEIEEKVKKYPISKELKRNILFYLDELG